MTELSKPEQKKASRDTSAKEKRMLRVENTAWNQSIHVHASRNQVLATTPRHRKDFCCGNGKVEAD